MDCEFLEKLLSYETSDEEREMLCEVAYGKPFSECFGEIRRDDFTLGLENGKYKILSIGSTGEKQESVEIRFICAECGIFELPESFLYQAGERSIPDNIFGIDGRIIPRPQPPPEYYVTFYKAEIDDAMLAAFRKWSEKNMFPFNSILAIIKTQDKRDGGKKKKNGRRQAGA